MIVLTLGTFDLFHAGHVNLLRRCRQKAGIGGIVAVGLNTDAFVESYKGRAPVISYDGRKAVLAACRYVDEVVPNDQADGSAVDVLAGIDPDLIVVGSDWENRDYLGQLGISAAWLERHGVRVEYVPYTEGISSSAIREQVA